jgi:hypothetical protein
MKTAYQAPDGGVHTTLVNPARPARVTQAHEGSSAMADVKKVPGAAPRRRRRRNPSGLMGRLVKILLPAAAGGAIGYLEARPADNKWWPELDDGIKAVVLFAVAYAADRANQPHASGAASAFGGFYATRRGLRWYDEKNAAPKRGLAMKNLAGVMGQQGISPAQVDAALAAAIREAEAAPQGGVAGIGHDVDVLNLAVPELAGFPGVDRVPG